MDNNLSKPRNSINYQVGNIPTYVEQFTYKQSLTELSKSVDSDILQATLTSIFGRYLNSNVKGKSISDPFTLTLLIEHFIEECGNLELQEIEFIFKNGIKGTFGVIYNDISIDTICGCDGWIEQYYKRFRKLRIDKTPQTEIPNLSGQEMSADEFLKKYPEYAIRNELGEILIKAKTYKLELDDVKRFYEIKGLNKTDDVQEDMVVFSKKYFSLDEEIRNNIPEMKFILMEFSKFVVNNYNKVKG